MSKQVNLEPEIVHGNWSSSWRVYTMKYNSFVNPSTSCKTDIIISNIMQAIPTYITMQGLVKEK